jgi:hypothetical protein
MTWTHYLYGLSVLTEEQALALPVGELGKVAPVTCEILWSYGFTCEHMEDR